MHGMLFEKLIANDISTRVLWQLEYFLYGDQLLLHYTIILLEITYYSMVSPWKGVHSTECRLHGFTHI